jgi:APA family basic amino acid/polyamine antiporter
MATDGGAAKPAEQTLFVRKASGLVKGWSTGDGFRYSFFSTNIFLGIWGLTYAVFIPGGSVFWSIMICTLFVLLEVVVYAGLISAMPRAGGDYVWQSRVFHSSVGFVFGATGWWFILWLWIPIYAALMVNSFIKPIFRIVGWGGAADWLTTSNGIFIASLATIALATYLVAVGMKAYANFQKWALWIGLAGCAVAAILLLVTSKASFITSFNREMLDLYGAKDAYQATVKSAGEGMPSSMFAGSLKDTFKLIPFMAFWLLWPVWGATLYGEVRGAKDFRKNIYQMAGGLLAAVAIVIAFLFLVTKTMGWTFFEATANGYMGSLYAYIDPATLPAGSDYLSPTAMISWIVGNNAFQVILIAVISLLVFGWWGTVFLSSTRMIFASAFDRILPERVAKVTSGGVPVNALLLMAIPSVIVSAFYAYQPSFVQLTYDATLVIAVMFFVTGLAFMVMPWRAKSIWDNSAIPKMKIAGIPILSIAALIYAVFMGFNLWLWFYDKTNTYGIGYKNKNSMIFMGILYAAAIIIWIIAWAVRKRQGMALEAVAKEIPVE